MKSLPAIAFIAALVALVLLPLNPAIAGSALFLATLAPIVLTDYTRTRPSTVSAVMARVAARRRERFGLAA